MNIREELFALQDLKYKEFHKRLIPTIDEDTIIGVRIPALRALVKEFSATEEAAEFMKELPHPYYEENNVHAFLIEKIKGYDTCIRELDKFLPYVDNWATCDSMAPKVLKKHLPELMDKIKEWLASDQIYTVRYGIGLLMKFYLDEAFEEKYLQMVADVQSEEYYINMMIAWYFATALAKHYEKALSYLEEQKLDVWTHNKTIQKAVESHRITPEQKAYLKTLKRK
ncbi:MAG: DNA alkylation repair protein [bacterium]|nr:DNA alkylation repair protein [bacterium]